MGSKMDVMIIEDKGKESEVNRVKYGQSMLVEEGDKVKRGKRIEEWDKYKSKIMKEVEG